MDYQYKTGPVAKVFIVQNREEYGFPNKEHTTECSTLKPSKYQNNLTTEKHFSYQFMDIESEIFSVSKNSLYPTDTKVSNLKLGGCYGHALEYYMFFLLFNIYVYFFLDKC